MLAKNKNKYDMYIGLFFVVSGIFLFINITSMNVKTYDSLGSKFIPQFICASFAILGAALTLKSYLVNTKKKPGTAVTDSDEESVGLNNFSLKSSLLFLISTVAYFMALELDLGFVPSTSVYLIIEMMILNHGKKKYKLIYFVIFSVAVSVATYLIFVKFLMLMLP